MLANKESIQPMILLAQESLVRVSSDLPDRYLTPNTSQIALSISYKDYSDTRTINGMRVQLRLQSVCESTQSGQSLDFQPEGTFDPWLLLKHSLKTLIRLFGCSCQLVAFAGLGFNYYSDQRTIIASYD